MQNPIKFNMGCMCNVHQSRLIKWTSLRKNEIKFKYVFGLSWCSFKLKLSAWFFLDSLTMILIFLPFIWLVLKCVQGFGFKLRLLFWIHSLQNIFRLPGFFLWQEKYPSEKFTILWKAWENIKFSNWSFLHDNTSFGTLALHLFVGICSQVITRW